MDTIFSYIAVLLFAMFFLDLHAGDYRDALVSFSLATICVVLPLWV